MFESYPLTEPELVVVRFARITLLNRVCRPGVNLILTAGVGQGCRTVLPVSLNNSLSLFPSSARGSCVCF
jgi:hypothetical protein